MKENKYDDPTFFEKYSQMNRSQLGLDGAGEWATLEPMLPDLAGKRILDLGCGFGWHCGYAMQHGAASAIGIDISQRMIERARKMHSYDTVEYLCMPIEEYEYPKRAFDLVFSSLAFHYIEEFGPILKKIHRSLIKGGWLIFSVEHPVFTSYGTQDWYYGEDGEALHFPVDRYFLEGRREANFLGERVIKYHRTLTSYLDGLLQNGFAIRRVAEPQPTAQMLVEMPEMEQELRRPMMLIVAAQKK